MSNSSTFWHPGWSVLVPFLALTALFYCPEERRLPVTLLSASVYALLQWLLPLCRWRRDNYFCPINVALGLLLLKLCLIPVLVMTTGPLSRVLSFLPTYSSMQGSILIDTVAYVAFCIGLTLAPRQLLWSNSPVLRTALSLCPHHWYILLFLAIGLLGFGSMFRHPAELFLYFQDPASMTEMKENMEGTWTGLLTTILRPFLAFGLVAWWANSKDSGSPAWRSSLVGLVAVVGITIANLTFSFNRAAFVFPLLCLAAVYNARVRRIPFGVTILAVALFMPLLIAIGSYRSTPETGGASAETTLAEAANDVSENLQAYAGGPQYTAIFYDRIGWGERPYGGSTLIASVMSPIPVLGKSFRETSGPALFNLAIYGTLGIEDQIIPFSAELFANFHLPGVIFGFFLLAMFLSQAERWFVASQSMFFSFFVQYISLWVAMLAVWSAAIVSQIAIYFFVPIYFYLGSLYTLAWLKGFQRRSLAPALVGTAQ